MEKKYLDKFLKHISSAEKIYFISDIHFGCEHPDKEMEKIFLFKKILNRARKNNIPVVLVGDIFDFLFDYGKLLDITQLPMLAELYWTVKEKGDLYYILGNHDFWGKELLENFLGIPTSYILAGEINHKKFWASHGETVEKNTPADKLFRWMLHNSFNISSFRLLYPRLANLLARSISHMSRGHSSKLNYSFDKYIQFARKKWEQGLDYVILAHLHQPFIYSENHKYLIITGDWLIHRTMLVYSKGRFYHEVLN
ncbi:MAG: UDP-2,3-diacylglucosamine diphosphatase [bacterium]